MGVSSCLLGEEVRYNGGHKRSAWVQDNLGAYVSFVPVCPEVEIGLGIPRETLRLVADSRTSPPDLIAPASESDHTTTMQHYARRKTAELKKLGLHGYVLKKGSPSCGMERVKIYSRAGMPLHSGRGMFAEALMNAMPLIPVEEEGRLSDPRLRENFIVRLFAFHRLQLLFAPRWRVRDLVAFQAAEKMLLMAHSPKAQKELGKLVADAKKISRSELRQFYEERFMLALARPAPTKRHVNVLQHMFGYLKRIVDAEQKRLLLASIEDFARGFVPLVVPITMIRHYVELKDVEYLKGQTYLEPHPKELMLRNHV